mgnify:CR=1 FL=1
MSLDGKIKPLLLHKDTRSSILSAVIYQIPNLLKRSSSFALVIKSSLLKELIPSRIILEFSKEGYKELDATRIEICPAVCPQTTEDAYYTFSILGVGHDPVIGG